MQPSRRTFLKGLGAAAGAAALGDLNTLGGTPARAASKTSVSVWAVPFVYATSPEAKIMDPFIQAQIGTTVPDVQLSTAYGPGTYADMQSKYLIQSKTGIPDIIEGLLENVVAYIRAGDIAPIDTQFNAWMDKAQFVPAALNAVRYNGQILGIPYNTNARGMIYRKSILKKLGLKVPTTWDELITTAEAITAKQSSTGMAGTLFCTHLTDPRGAQEFLGLFFQLNKHLFTLDPTTKKWTLRGTVAQFEKVFTLYYNLWFGSKTTPAVANPANAAGLSSYALDPGYVTGQYAMVPMGPWILSRQTQGAVQKQILLEDTGVATMPVAAGGTPASYLEVKPWMLNKYSKNPDAAWKVMETLASGPVISKWVTVEGFTPPRYDVLKSKVVSANWWAASFAKLLPQGVALDPLNWAPVYTAILTQIQTVVFGQSSPSKAANDLHSALSGLVSQGIL